MTLPDRNVMGMSCGMMRTARVAIGRVLCALPIACLFLSALVATAVDPHIRISQYSHVAWQMPEGIPSHPIAITQTTDGYIWIATFSGLLKFDGVKFTEWQPLAGQPKPYRGPQHLLGSRDGSLWLGTQNGLSRIKDGRVTNYVEGPTDSGVSALLEDHTGKIWLTRYRIRDKMGPLCWAKETTLECYGKNEGLPAKYALGIAEDNAGDIWLGCQRLCRWEHGSTKTYFDEQMEHPAGEGVEDVASIYGEIWAATDGAGPKLGIQHFSNGKWASYTLPGLDGSKLSGSILFVDRHQTLWIGTNAGMYHVHDGIADHYGRTDGLTSDGIQSFYEDKEGNLWVATDQGLDMFRDQKVTTFSKNQGLSSATVHALLPVKGEAIWVGGDGGLDIIESGAYSSIRHQEVPGEEVLSMLADSKGQIWLGVDHKVFAYDRGRYIEARNTDGGPLGEIGEPTAFAEEPDGDVWVLSNGPISGANEYLLGIRNHRVRQRIPINNAGITSVAGDRRVGFWALSDNGKLMHYVDGRIAESTSLVKAGTHIAMNALDVDSHNVVWVSSTLGLYRWANGRKTVLNDKNGLTCSAVQSVTEDDQGSHWLRTSCGIVHITAGEWENWLRSPESKIATTLIGPLDGARGGSSQNQPAVGMTRNGRIWFTANSVLQMVDPSRMPASLPPPVQIEKLIADHHAYESLEKLRLPPLRGELQIDYTSLSFKLPQRAQFRYKLEGHDEDWQDVGTRRQAFYSKLAPGKYRFCVIASNSDGLWNKTGASLEFSILPAYYQTTWFRALCGMAPLLLIWLMYQYRVRQLRRQFKVAMDARVEERTRIARELHDTLLQSFQGLLLRFQAVSNLLPGNPTEAKQRVDSAIEQAAIAVTEGRDAVHELRSGGLAAIDLAESIGNFARELLGQTSLGGTPELQLQVEGTPLDLNLIIRDEVYRIAAEALRNAIRHAEPKKIDVTIRYDQECLKLRIRDDGKGIDTTVLDKEHAPGHWGLRGMRERAKLIGANFEIWSKLGSGTEIELEIPGANAYLRSSSARAVVLRPASSSKYE